MFKKSLSKNKVILILFTLIIALYLFWGRAYIFSDLEKHVKHANNPYYSEELDFSKDGTLKIETGNLYQRFEDNIVQVYLVCQKTEEMQGGNYWDKEFSLKLKIDAYAVTDNDVITNRLVINFFQPSNEPMKDESKLWSGWADNGMEYQIGSMVVFPKEKQFVELSIMNPDLFLNQAKPRLKIVASYDPAVLGHFIYLKILRDGALLICLAGLAYVFISALNRANRE